MNIVEQTCESCGAILDYDPSTGILSCRSCGKKYIVRSEIVEVAKYKLEEEKMKKEAILELERLKAEKEKKRRDTFFMFLSCVLLMLLPFLIKLLYR